MELLKPSQIKEMVKKKNGSNLNLETNFLELSEESVNHLMIKHFELLLTGLSLYMAPVLVKNVF